MSAFTAFTAYERVTGTRKRHVLRDDLLWEIGARGSGWVPTVPAGYTFDISVPRWLEWLLSPFNRRVLLAAAIHDRLLELGHDVAFASSEFRRAVRALGVHPIPAMVLFLSTLIWTAIGREIAGDAK